MASDLTFDRHPFTELDDRARLWIFKSDRRLGEQQVTAIQRHLDEFLPHWTSHNRSLLAKGAVLHNRFVVIALDEQSSSAASGCSIDSMTHQIQDISSQLSANLQDRTTFYFVIDDDILGIPMHEVASAYQSGQINDDTLVFNSLVKTREELDTNWLIPLKDSWHKRFA